MKVSVVIPVYNGENYLEETIQSVLNQTEEPFEILVVDDGSTDSTPQIVQKYSKIKYIHKKNGGVSSALNVGLREMKGDYFSWLSHDDLYLPQRQKELGKLFKDIQDPHHTIIAHDIQMIDPEGKLLKTVKIPPRFQPILPYGIYSGWAFHGCASLIPRQLLLDLGGFPEDKLYCQDTEMWLRLGNHGAKYIHIPEVYTGYRMHPNQGSVQKKQIMLTELDKVYLQGIEECPQPKEMIKFLYPKKTYTQGLFYLAQHHFHITKYKKTSEHCIDLISKELPEEKFRELKKQWENTKKIPHFISPTFLKYSFRRVLEKGIFSP